jgi:hypothetical protein
MMTVLKDLKASIILPMHYFGSDTLETFLAEARKSFKVTYNAGPNLVVSSRTLPTENTVIVLPGY